MTRKLRLNTGVDEQWNMIRTQAKKDRTIDSFPRAFLDEATPYSVTDFSAKVKENCAARKLSKSSKSDDFELNISKLVSVGDVSVGKTSLIHKFCHDLYNRDYKATIGVDFEIERFDVLDVPYTLQLWDTAGQERFKSIAASYYRGANVILVVFDLSDAKTLESCRRWLKESIEGNDSNPSIFLIGTKKDLCSVESFRRMQAKAIELSKEIKAEYWPISSKTGENIQMLFSRIAAMSFDALLCREMAAEVTKSPIVAAPVIKLKKRATPKEITLKLLRRARCKKIA